jgi:hypothetical protein
MARMRVMARAGIVESTARYGIGGALWAGAAGREPCAVGASGTFGRGRATNGAGVTPLRKRCGNNRYLRI